MKLTEVFQTLTGMQQNLLVLIPRSAKSRGSISSFDFCNVAYLHPYGEKRLDLYDDSCSGERLDTGNLARIMDYIIKDLVAKNYPVEEYKLFVPSKHHYNSVYPLSKILVKRYYSNPNQPFHGSSFDAVFLEPSSSDQPEAF